MVWPGIIEKAVLSILVLVLRHLPAYWISSFEPTYPYFQLGRDRPIDFSFVHLWFTILFCVRATPLSWFTGGFRHSLPCVHAVGRLPLSTRRKRRETGFVSKTAKAATPPYFGFQPLLDSWTGEAFFSIEILIQPPNGILFLKHLGGPSPHTLLLPISTVRKFQELMYQLQSFRYCKRGWISFFLWHLSSYLVARLVVMLMGVPLRHLVLFIYIDSILGS